MNRVPGEIARIVIECVPKAPGGFAYRVWTEHNGHVFGEVRAPLLVTAVSEMLAKVERGDLTPFEPAV